MVIFSVIPDASVNEHVRDLLVPRSRTLSLSKLASSLKQATFRDDVRTLSLSKLASSLKQATFWDGGELQMLVGLFAGVVMNKRAKSRDYQEYLLETLKDPDEAKGYLKNTNEILSFIGMHLSVEIAGQKICGRKRVYDVRMQK